MVYDVFREKTPLSPPLKLFLAPCWSCLRYSDELPSSEYLRKIQSILKSNSVVLPHHSVSLNLKPDQVPPSISSCSHVFVREDSSKPPLSPLYRGPFLVLTRTPKYFVIQVGSKPDSVSVDRLKPVFSDHPMVPQQPPRHGNLRWFRLC